MRVLILGGAGMLGHRLVISLRDRFDTWTTVRAPLGTYERYGIFDPNRTLDGVDVQNFDALVSILAKVHPDVVINCVGIIKQLPAAHDALSSVGINSLLPLRLEQLCGATGARLIHFSTDCVFSGRKGMYTEDDLPDAEDLYGRSKFLGEASGPAALTIRSSIIGRELSTSSGLVEWFLSQRDRRVEGYTAAIYSGFTTLAMSRIVCSILLEHPQLRGIVHVSSDPIAKYDLLVLLREVYKVRIDISPSNRVQIDRSLDSSKFRARTRFVPPSWAEMVNQMAADPTPYEQWRAGRA